MNELRKLQEESEQSSFECFRNNIIWYLNSRYCPNNGLSEDVQLMENVLSIYIPSISELEADCENDGYYVAEFEDVHFITPFYTTSLTGNIYFRLYNEFEHVGDELIDREYVEFDRIELINEHTYKTDYSEYKILIGKL